METQRKRQAELIHQLKGQLEELESYAYESGEGTMPSNVLLERQRVVMGELLSFSHHTYLQLYLGEKKLQEKWSKPGLYLMSKDEL